MLYPKGTVKALIESAARRGNIPDSQMAYVLNDFLDVAYEELNSFALPVLHARRDDYYLEEVNFDVNAPDQYIGSSQYALVRHPAWRLPDWMMANTVRDVQAIGPGGTFYQIGRITPDDSPNMVSQGWYFYGNYIVLQYNMNRSATPPVALRVIAHVKPNLLVTHTETLRQQLNNGNLAVSNAVRITSVVSPTEIWTDPPGDFNPPYADWTLDHISGENGYEIKNRNLTVFVGGPGTSALRFATAPTVAFKVGDWMCLSGYTPVVPLPDELHPLLAQRLVVKFLEAQGEENQLNQARESLAEMTRQVPLLLQPRAEGKPKKIAPRMGLWRRWRW